MFFQCHDDDNGVVDGKYKRYSTILSIMYNIVCPTNLLYK